MVGTNNWTGWGSPCRSANRIQPFLPSLLICREPVVGVCVYVCLINIFVTYDNFFGTVASKLTPHPFHLHCHFVHSDQPVYEQLLFWSNQPHNTPILAFLYPVLSFHSLYHFYLEQKQFHFLNHLLIHISLWCVNHQSCSLQTLSHQLC